MYHFGSRDGLLVEIVREVEQRQREAFAADLARTGDDPVATARAMWKRLTSPALAGNERLFFELYGRALGGDAGAAPLLVDVVESWLQPVAGVDRAEQRLGLAVIRGLLLDLLATGDRRGTTQAFERYLGRVAATAAATVDRPASGEPEDVPGSGPAPECGVGRGVR